jgi:hypothetical protein
MPESNPTRRRFRFRLRTLLIVIAIIAIPLAWLGKERGQSRREQQLAERLRQQGFKTIMLAGPYYSWAIELKARPPGTTKSDGWWRKAARWLLGERILLAYDPPPDFNDLTQLSGLTNLQGLHIRSPPGDLTPLAEFSKLVVLSFDHAEVSDFSALAGLNNLEVLHIEGLRVTDISTLAELPSLRMLGLRTTNLSDLTPLHGLQNLDTIFLQDAHVSKDEVDRLQKALPNCQIGYAPSLAADYGK